MPVLLGPNANPDGKTVSLHGAADVGDRVEGSCRHNSRKNTGGETQDSKVALEVALEDIAEWGERFVSGSGRLDIGQISEGLEEEKGGTGDDGVVEIPVGWKVQQGGLVLEVVKIYLRDEEVLVREGRKLCVESLEASGEEKGACRGSSVGESLGTGGRGGSSSRALTSKDGYVDKRKRHGNQWPATTWLAF